MLSSHRQLISLFEILRRDRLPQLPHHVHRLRAFRFHIVRKSQESIRCSTQLIALVLTDKYHHVCAHVTMMYVALTGLAFGSCSALALPVEQLAVNGIIVVHGGGRIVLVRLVERQS